MRPHLGRALAPTTAAAVVLAALAAVPPTHAASCAQRRAHTPWTTVDLPDFPGTSINEQQRYPGHATAYEHPTLVASGGQVDRLFASDGVTLTRSTDGVCTWQVVLSLDATQAEPATATRRRSRRSTAATRSSRSRRRRTPGLPPPAPTTCTRSSPTATA